MDTTAFNYNDLNGDCFPDSLTGELGVDVNTDDGNCISFVLGCLDANAFNYNMHANTQDGLCIDVITACTDLNYSNYNELANTNNYSCISWEEYSNDLQNEVSDLKTDLSFAIGTIEVLEADLNTAFANQEDGIGQVDLDYAYLAGLNSIQCEELITENIPLSFPVGWSIFGFTSIEPLDAEVGFTAITDKIEIVKDAMGLSYLPEWGFNALVDLHFSEGYQIKMFEQLDGFQFCSTFVNSTEQE